MDFSLSIRPRKFRIELRKRKARENEKLRSLIKSSKSLLR
jgi:hypothetical protein